MELSKEIQLRQKEFSESYLKKANETLLPHQVKRLQQISKQQRVKRMNQFQDEFGVAASMADELGLSEEERDRLVDAIKDCDWPKGRVQTCIACESTAIKAIRHYLLLERRLPKQDCYISGYWKIGLIEDEHQKMKRTEAAA